MSDNFHGMMNEAFAKLKRSEACPGHQWRKPELSVYGYGKYRTHDYATRCKLCGLRASRPTLERLEAEVIAVTHRQGED